MLVNLTNRQIGISLLAILLAGFVFGCVSIAYPFGRDQGIYAYAGKLLLQGKVDYKYVFDLKPPGVHYLFALEQFIMGESMLNMRIFDMIWESATAFVIFLISFRISKSFQASIIGAVLYVFLYYRLDFWHTLQADGFLNLPFTLAILLLLRNAGNYKILKHLLAGILFALVLAFKYTLVVFVPFVIIAFYFDEEFKEQRTKSAVLFLCGILFVISVIFAFYYLNDAFSQFIDAQFVQIPLYAKIGYENTEPGFIRNNIIRLFAGSVYSPLIFFGIAAFVFYLVKKEIDYNKLIIFFWAITSIASIIAQFKFFYYHFLEIIPPLVIFASMIGGILLKFNQKRISYTIVIGVFALYFFMGFKPYTDNYRNLINLGEGNKSLEELYLSNGTIADSTYTIFKTFHAVDYVKLNTKPDDKIYVWGFDALVYYLSGRASSSRFIYSFPLFWKEKNTDKRSEFSDELNRNIPAMILVSQNDVLPYVFGYNEDSKQMIEHFPEFKLLLERRYIFKQQVDNFFVYELKKENNFQ